LNHVDSQAHANKNSNHDLDKRKKTKSCIYSEGGNVKETNAQA
jgi:hypothetical protein